MWETTPLSPPCVQPQSQSWVVGNRGSSTTMLHVTSWAHLAPMQHSGRHQLCSQGEGPPPSDVGLWGGVTQGVQRGGTCQAVPQAAVT
jgi:hypothetical protein